MESIIMEGRPEERKARSRKDRPCDHCRKRKSRCFIKQGDAVCVLCLAEGHECTFLRQPGPRKRTKPAPAHQPIDHRSQPAPSVPPFAAREPPPEEGSAVIGLTPKTEADDTLNLYEGATVDFAGLRGDLQDYGLHGRHEDDKGGRGRTEGSGKDQQGKSSTLELSRRRGDLARFEVVSEEGGTLSTQRRRTLFPARLTLDEAVAIVSPHHDTLVELFFRVVHPHYPIFSRERVQGGFPQRHTLPAGTQSAVTPMYCAILVAASRWKMLYSSPSTADFEAKIAYLDDFVHHACYADAAMPRLVTMQTMLLHHMLLSPTANALVTWSAVGSLVATAQNLGLHISPEPWNIKLWEVRIRKRLWWACFVADKFMALSLGRPSHIGEGQFTVKELNYEDFDEPESRAGHLMAFSLLARILSDVLASLFSPATIPQLVNSFSESVKAALPLLDAVDTYYEALPTHLRFASLSTHGAEDFFDNSGSLHLAFYAVKVSVLRAILRCKGPRDPEKENQVRQIVVGTMEDICRWTSTLTARHWLALWFLHSRYGFALLANFMLAGTLTATSEDEFEAARSNTRSFRWTLKLHLYTNTALLELATKELDRYFPDGPAGETCLRQLWLSNRDREAEPDPAPSSSDDNRARTIFEPPWPSDVIFEPPWPSDVFSFPLESASNNTHLHSSAFPTDASLAADFFNFQRLFHESPPDKNQSPSTVPAAGGTHQVSFADDFGIDWTASNMFAL